MTTKEFIFWALGEKVGELRERLEVKNLSKISYTTIPEIQAADKTIQQQSDPKSLMKVPEVSKYLKISRSNAYHLLKNGEIPVIKFGRSVRVREEDLEEYISKSKR